MKIELKEIPVRELVADYEDQEEAGVRGYGGKLDIRPPYQREFIYGAKERQAVIETVTKDFPLNVMYWSVRDDGNFEVIDGQQRTISICQFIEGDFSWNDLYFHNLTDDQQEQILNYKLMVYFCEGTESERLSWFETINIAGKELTKQELRNAVFSGPWLSDAKKYFSKTDCVAYKIGGDLMKGTPIRQEYLETVIAWKCADKSDSAIRDFMGKNQKKSKANDLWIYFQNVVAWVRATFPVERKREMNGQPWGMLYNDYKDADLDPDALEERVSKLMADPDVTNKKGIYLFVLNGKEKHLSIRQFDERMRREAYERQKGICPVEKEHFKIEEMEADHIMPWHAGGKTTAENCQMLSKEANRRKGGK